MASEPSVTIRIPSQENSTSEKPQDNNPDPVSNPVDQREMSVEERYHNTALEYLRDPENRQKLAKREWEHITFAVKKVIDKYHGELTDRDAARITIGFLNKFYLASGDELLKRTAQSILFTILMEDLISLLHRTNGILPSEAPPSPSEGDRPKIEIVRR